MMGSPDGVKRTFNPWACVQKEGDDGQSYEDGNQNGHTKWDIHAGIVTTITKTVNIYP